MKLKYVKLLDPQLYSGDDYVQIFVTELHTSVNEASNKQAQDILSNKLLSADSISEKLTSLAEEAKATIKTKGILLPRFRLGPTSGQEVVLQSQMPENTDQVSQFLVAAKAMALARIAQYVFFQGLHPIKNKKPIIGPQVNAMLDSWGILTIGSSLRGNCFISLEELIEEDNKVAFIQIENGITRERETAYPYNAFFQIKSDEEMKQIIQQMPQVMKQCQLDRAQCIINVATTLKILNFLSSLLT